MTKIDQEAADRQSRRVAQIVSWVIFLVMLAIAVFATWAAVQSVTFDFFPDVFMPVVAVVMWIGLIGLAVKAFRGSERRKSEMNEE